MSAIPTLRHAATALYELADECESKVIRDELRRRAEMLTVARCEVIELKAAVGKFIAELRKPACISSIDDFKAAKEQLQNAMIAVGV